MNYEILLNPMLVSVIVLCILCLCKINVILSLLVSAFVAGLLSGLGFTTTMDLFVTGMGANSETALSYILLGTFAVAMTQTGFAQMLSKWAEKIIKDNKYMLLGVLLLMAIASQNLIPVHIAFIPIVIPPLLYLMNKLKIDRRAVASVLAYGLKAPYIVIPAGFGLIFQTLVADYMTQSGMTVSVKDVWNVNWFLGVGMTIALLVAVFVSYRKPREYQNLPLEDNVCDVELKKEDVKFNKNHLIILVAAFATLAIQLWTGSLPFGAIVGLAIIFITGIIRHNKSDDLINKGIFLMGHIAFVMLTAAGFAYVLQEGGGIESFLEALLPYLTHSKLLTTFLILLLGLFITMGIGSSFGTIPIVTVLIVPVCIKMGLSVPASIILISATAALGDAGSPVSDTTLGPTAGLNADSQHDHIKDSCVPTFIHYTVFLIIFAIIAVYIF